MESERVYTKIHSTTLLPHRSIKDSAPARYGADAKRFDFESECDDWLYPPNVDPSDEDTLTKLAIAIRCTHTHSQTHTHTHTHTRRYADEARHGPQPRARASTAVFDLRLVVAAPVVFVFFGDDADGLWCQVYPDSPPPDAPRHPQQPARRRYIHGLPCAQVCISKEPCVPCKRAL